MPLILHIARGERLLVRGVVLEARRRMEVAVLTPDADVERLRADGTPARKEKPCDPPSSSPS